MAATLMDIKSRMLLPRPEISEFIDEEAQADPRRELVARLLEYKRYKAAAGLLTQRAQTARRSHSRFGGPGGPPAPCLLTAGTGGADAAGGETLSPGDGPEDKPVGVTLSDLVASLQEVLREYDRRGPLELVRETYTVADRLAEIVPLLIKAGDEGLDFTELLRRAATRRGAVVNFLALLELLRRGRVRFAQDRAFGPIRVWALPGLAQQGWSIDVQ
jgi:segregation and condensation protein A